MEDILFQIEEALRHKLYYIALQSTLLLPDICGALNSNNGKATKRKYIEWYEKFYLNKYYGLTGEDCYYFRCANIHQGYFQHTDSSYDKVVFIAHDLGSIHNVVIRTPYNGEEENWYALDIKLFCNNMIDAVRTWLKSVKNEPDFIRNYAKMVKLHKNEASFILAGADLVY